jgi:hypothetical protein
LHAQQRKPRRCPASHGAALARALQPSRTVFWPFLSCFCAFFSAALAFLIAALLPDCFALASFFCAAFTPFFALATCFCAALDLATCF